MREYRFYVLDAEGHVFGPAQITGCSDDDDAIQKAAELLDKRAIEIWDGPRRVACLKPGEPVWRAEQDMAHILPFRIPDTQFDPETVVILSTAYDRAISEVNGQGQPEVVREVIAKRIVALASKGERNPDRLCEAALRALGVSGAA